MKLGTALLKQLERCGLAAQIAEEHAEISDSEFRETRIEIARAFHANDQAQLPEAAAALRWLATEPGTFESVGEPLDLIDATTGEVIVTGKPDVVLSSPEGVLVVSWADADWHVENEPEDDLGLLAMGLAAAKGRPFRVATVALRDDEAFPQRSPVIEPDKHAGLLARIKAAKSRPRVACPGEWCGACKQAPYCEAWLARAKTSLAAISNVKIETVTGPDGKVVEVPQLDITNENAGEFAVQFQMAKKVLELLNDQLKAHVRRGGRCVVNGKMMTLGECKGRETVSASDLRQLVAMRTLPVGALADVAASLKDQDGYVVCLKSELEALVKVGDPYETPRWKNVETARKNGARR